MADAGVGKVPPGATKPPSRMNGGIGPIGPPFNRGEELTVPFPALKIDCLGEYALICANPQISAGDALLAPILCSFASDPRVHGIPARMNIIHEYE